MDLGHRGSGHKIHASFAGGSISKAGKAAKLKAGERDIILPETQLFVHWLKGFRR